MGIPDGKRVGINSAGANILCAKHNSDLNVLDDEIVRLADACAEFYDSPRTSSIAINGVLIERWMLKYIFGSCAAGYINGQKMFPDELAVRQLFGLVPLNERFVLYGLRIPSVPREWNRFVSFTAFSRAGYDVDMGLFLVNALPIFTFVGKGDPQEALRSVKDVRGMDVRNASVIRRPSAMQVRQPDDPGACLTIKFSY
jgi:hypothetical protein